ncbi:mechanosensitive ion channel family protein [[Phormidium] sp. ETS-05]|uniref:mechanosensitive ion channel family protein n=1 Tax=[Phormidium] sp. ETS-05 TaxID=222819 RepID=UPI0018EF0827|nr:mechanosensitive ion channel family protein [[Phormidium] sp. ETS-05]
MGTNLTNNIWQAKFRPIRWPQQWRSGVGLLAISLLTMILVVTGVNGAIAQNTANAPAPISSLVHAPINIDGRDIFQVASSAATATIAKSSNLPIQQRVELIEREMYSIIKTGFDVKTLAVTYTVENGNAPIQVADGQQLTGSTVMLVTPLDAQLHGLTVEQWAQELTHIIRNTLIQAQWERQPDYLRRQGLRAGGIFAGAIVLTWFLIRTQKPKNATSSVTATPSPTPTTDIFTSVEQENRQEERQDIRKFKSIFWQIEPILIWLVALAGIADLFPQTRWLRFWLFAEPLSLVAICFGARLAIRVSDLIIDRSLDKMKPAANTTSAAAERQFLRFSTFANVLKGVFAFIWGFAGAVLALQTLRISITPILTGAGLAGFAISFASQSLIKDVVNGCLILWEDWYAIGDAIAVGDVAGQVEYINLRITKIRNPQGELILIPNSEIDKVHNRSKDWARIDCEIEVAYDADIKLVMEVMQEAAAAMQRHPQWQDKIINPSKIIGVNGISHSGIKIVIWMETQPGEQWGVMREYRYRLKLAFDEKNICIGIPGMTIWWPNAPTKGGDSLN